MSWVCRLHTHRDKTIFDHRLPEWLFSVQLGGLTEYDVSTNETGGKKVRQTFAVE